MFRKHKKHSNLLLKKFTSYECVNDVQVIILFKEDTQCKCILFKFDNNFFLGAAATATGTFSFSLPDTYMIQVSAVNAVSSVSVTVSVLIENSITGIYGKYTVPSIVYGEPVALAASIDERK